MYRSRQWRLNFRMVLSAAKPGNICERVRELEPANSNPNPAAPFPSPTNTTTNPYRMAGLWSSITGTYNSRWPYWS